MTLFACQEKPKPKPIDDAKVAYEFGKSIREIKNAFKKGYTDTLKTDTIQ